MTNIITEILSMERILIIDDEEATLFSYKKLLKSPALAVDTCHDFSKAIAFIDNNDYRAVITDLRLSHSESMEGLDILKYIRKNHPATPVILLTGYGSDEIRKQAISLGTVGYFDKPVQITAIVELLAKLGVPVGDS